jgi:hypothetical protein
VTPWVHDGHFLDGSDAAGDDATLRTASWSLRQLLLSIPRNISVGDSWALHRALAEISRGADPAAALGDLIEASRSALQEREEHRGTKYFWAPRFIDAHQTLIWLRRVLAALLRLAEPARRAWASTFSAGLAALRCAGPPMFHRRPSGRSPNRIDRLRPAAPHAPPHAVVVVRTPI